MWHFNLGSPHAGLGNQSEWTGLVDSSIPYNSPLPFIAPVSPYYLLKIRFDASQDPFSDPETHWPDFDLVVGLDELILRTEGRYQWRPVTWGEITLPIHGAESPVLRYSWSPHPFVDSLSERSQAISLYERCLESSPATIDDQRFRWHPDNWRLRVDRDHWKIINQRAEVIEGGEGSIEDRGAHTYHLAYPETISPNAIVTVEQDECPRRFFRTLGGNTFYFTYWELEGEIDYVENPWRLPIEVTPFWA